MAPLFDFICPSCKDKFCSTDRTKEVFCDVCKIKMERDYSSPISLQVKDEKYKKSCAARDRIEKRLKETRQVLEETKNEKPEGEFKLNEKY